MSRFSWIEKGSAFYEAGKLVKNFSDRNQIDNDWNVEIYTIHTTKMQNVYEAALEIVLCGSDSEMFAKNITGIANSTWKKIVTEFKLYCRVRYGNEIHTKK